MGEVRPSTLAFDLITPLREGLVTPPSEERSDAIAHWQTLPMRSGVWPKRSEGGVGHSFLRRVLRCHCALHLHVAPAMEKDTRIHSLLPRKNP